VRQEKLGQQKNPMTSGTELATFRFVVSCINRMPISGSVVPPADSLAAILCTGIFIYVFMAFFIYFNSHRKLIAHFIRTASPALKIEAEVGIHVQYCTVSEHTT
jgi:hypothetical protein